MPNMTTDNSGTIQDLYELNSSGNCQATRDMRMAQRGKSRVSLSKMCSSLLESGGYLTVFNHQFNRLQAVTDTGTGNAGTGINFK